ncbi:LPS export ABC transporter periplasmic protein LptC [Bacteroidales bacterium OttesenSCG-928-L03]|nr:LPS export ABC transporter periplasmic protein LptC [Bacteroidales bacterium OttesenSCG-928-L03]
MVLQEKSSIILILLSCILMVGCGKSKTISTVAVDPAALPDIHTEDITTLISDSGITRYRMQAEIWDMFSSAQEPYWYFPQGIYLERFDSLFVAEGSIKADTAYYYESKELWHLIGNVLINNLEGESFETQELFWDQKERPESQNAIYTDKFVRIEQKDKIVTSVGLRSNQSMTRYTLFESYIEAYVNEKAEAPVDTTRVNTPPAEPAPIESEKQIKPTQGSRERLLEKPLEYNRVLDERRQVPIERMEVE